MAWGTQYKAQFLQHDGLLKEVRLLTDGFSGEPIEWCCGSGAVEYDRGNGDGLFPQSILFTTTVSISIVFEELYDLSAIIHSRKSVKVQIFNITDDVQEFTGWLEPWNASHPYHSPIFEVSMTATCGLGRLQNIPYPMTAGISTVVPALDIVQKCLAQIENGIDTHVCIHTFALGGTATVEALKSFSIDETRWYNGSEPLKCDQILQDVLVRFSPRVFQEDNAWKIHSTADRSRGYNGYRVYEEGSSVLVANNGSFADYYEVNGDEILDSDGATLGVGTIVVEPPINKWVAAANLAPKRQIIFNGDLRLWDEDGPVGWTMNMPAGNPGWERFDATDPLYPYGLKFSGNNTFKAYKKRGWASLGIFYGRDLIDAPTNFIETPISKFNPAEKSIIVEFDYSTSNIPNGFIGIRLMNDDETESVWINSEGKIHNKNRGDFWPVDFAKKIAYTGGRSGGVPDLGKFSLEIPLFNEIDRRSGNISIWNKIAIRFYATGDHPIIPKNSGLPGGNPGTFWLYAVRVVIGENGGRSVSGDYRYELSKDADKGDEGETVNLMTGDYSLWWSGTTYLDDGVTPTSKWRRAGKPGEEISIYRAMLLDRLSLTWKSVMCLEGDIQMLSNDKRLKFSSILNIPDLENRKFEIVRYRENLVEGVASIRAIHIQHDEPEAGDLKTETFVGGVRQMAQDGRRDGVYPNENNPGPGNTTSVPPSEEEPIDAPMFREIDPLIFVVERNRSYEVDLTKFFTEEFEDAVDDLDFEIGFKIGDKPIWATAAAEDWIVTVSGTPAAVGSFSILVELTNEEGFVVEVARIPVIVLPAPSLTYTISPGRKLIPSQPVTLPHTPPYTLTVQTKGGHDAYRWVHRFAGAVQYDSDIIPVAYTETATYAPISAASLAQGIHVVFFQLFRQTGVDENDDPIYTAISGDDLIFKLGTTPEDPYRTVKLELMAGGVPVGEIPNTFAYIEEWDIRPTPTGIKYDELFLSVLPEEEPYTNTLTPTLTGVSFGLESEILDGSNGATSPDAGYQTTDAIPVVAGQEFWLGSAPYSAAGYNSGSFVTELSGEVLTIPAGVNQIRICWANGSLTDVSLAELIGTLFGGDAPKGAGNFTVFVRARFGGSQEYERMAELIVLEKEPEEPIEQEGITLIQPGNPLVKLVDPLPIEGAVIPLPPAFGLLFSGFGAIQYDKIAWKLFQGISGMSEVSLPMYTGQPSEKSYGSPVTAATQLLFWGKDSTEIGTIHQAPNRFLAEVIATLKGEKVAIAKADWIFSNTPIGPGTGMTYGYYDPSAQVLSTMVPDVPATGGIYKLVKLAGQGWVVGALTWNSSTQYNKVETEVNGVIVHTWTGALKSSNTVDESFDWNRSVPGLDEPGEKTIKQRFYNGVTLIGTKQATITFYPEDPEIKDPNECCSGGGDSEGISVTIGNGTDNLYGIPHPYGDRPLVVSVYRASDMAQTYPGIRTPTGMVWVSFKSPLAVNARIVVIRPI